MVIEKVHCIKKSGEIFLEPEPGSVEMALITFSDGDFLKLCEPATALAEYDKLNGKIEDEPLESVEKKKCPLCGGKGGLYFKIKGKMYHPCRQCADRLMELYFKL